jgi:zinc/manganese transport system substrate-binding protein
MTRLSFLHGWLAALTAPALSDPVKVVAAENFYGDLARQIGGDNVAVTSILSNPDDDPHLFEASPNTAKALKDANVVIVNGVDYDPWMEKLLSANKAPARKEIVGYLVGHKAGDNPHLWYDPAYMKAAGDQAGLLGLKVRNEKYLAIMNNAEPTPSEVAGFENDLKGHKVKVMLYNAQASEPGEQKLVQLAKDNGIPVVGVSETEPPDSTYQAWMLGQLSALDKALGPTQ